MRRFVQPPSKKRLLRTIRSSWSGGLDKLVSNTQIKPNRLSVATNIQLVEDGKIQLPRDGQDYFGVSSGSRVVGLYPYYKSDGTKELLRTAGTKLQKYSSSAWSDVSGYTYTTGLNTTGAMAYDRLYLVNGTDPLTYYDGSSIVSFTAVGSPTISSVTRTGTTGTYTFSYKVTSVTAVGESLPSSAVSQVINVSELDASNYMAVTWSAVTNAIGYNVYGRKDGQWYFLKYVEGNGSVTYADKGTDTPSEYLSAPSADTTSGPKAKYMAVYKDSLMLMGDPANPSRLSYSGGGDKINDFSVSGGGGFIDISKNDGQEGTGMIVFKDSLIVFKSKSIYKFNFSTSGAPQFELINAAIGCIAPRSIITVENDVAFASDRGIFFLGNSQGFSFDVLRTREATVNIRSIYQAIDPLYMENIAGIYATKNNVNVMIYSFTPSGETTNSRAIVLDFERGGWYEWTNIKANCFVQYAGSDGVQHVLYGDDSSGYVKELFSGTDDFGSAIDATFRIAGESFGAFNLYKTLKTLDILIRQPTGTIELSIIVDGVTTAFTIPIALIQPSVNFGHYLFGNLVFGDSYGSGTATEQDNNLLKTFKNLNTLGRNFLVEFTNNGTSAKMTLLSVGFTAIPRSIGYRNSEDIVAI